MPHDSMPLPIRLLHITDSHLGKDATVRTIDIKEPVPGMSLPLRSEILCDTIVGLASYLKDRGERIDAVIVSGDSTFKGYADGQKLLREYLLEHLKEVGITASNIVATPGNHDVVSGTEPGTGSRYQLFTDAWCGANSSIVPFLDGVHVLSDLLHQNHCLVAPNREWAIFPINSANWSQVSISPSANKDIAALSEHFNSLGNSTLTKAFDTLRRYDIARVSEGQLTALQRTIAHVGKVGIKIAVLHHHLLPVGGEEFKPFADITNLGPLRQVLRELEFDMIVHGHKHTASAYYEHIYPEDFPTQAPRRILTISGGTFGSPGGSDSPMRMLEITSATGAPVCVLQNFASVSPGRKLQTSCSAQYPMWEMDPARQGPLSLYGSSIDELYARAVQTVSMNPNRAITCTIDFEDERSQCFPNLYPYAGTGEEKREWFDETVQWWQAATSKSEIRIPYIHGGRLRRFGGSINQVDRIVDLLKSESGTSKAIALVVDPYKDFHHDQAFASFCFVQFCLRCTESKKTLDCVAYYRAQEFHHWWPVNVAELRYLQLEITKAASKSVGEICAGSITTFSPYPRLSSNVRQPTKVAVPLIDQWLDNYPARIAKMALAAGPLPLESASDGLKLWGRCLADFDHAMTAYHADGVPVALEGLSLLKEWIAAIDPNCEMIYLLESLWDLNNSIHKNPTKKEFDNWSRQGKNIVAELRTALERSQNQVP